MFIQLKYLIPLTCLKRKCHKEILKGGYLKKSKNFKPLNRDLSGKTILITGGNSGIGLDAACLLGSLGANVHIACRSKERGEAAVNQIKEKSKEMLNLTVAPYLFRFRCNSKMSCERVK